MSALSIQVPFPAFAGTDGQPLENGYIWIGTVNLNPQVNPIAVYWDAALTIAAAQPIRTLNGYPVYQGTPARLYVNSDYSIRVQDSKGSLVYSAPSATERYGNIISSSDIGFLQAGNGAVEISSQEKMRQILHVDDYGADPTGTSDSTIAIQNLIAYAESIGGGIIVLGNGSEYRLDNAPLVISQQNIAIITEGSTLTATLKVYNDASCIELNAARATFKGFRMEYAGPSPGTATSHGLDASSVQTPFINMENVTIQKFPGDGANFVDVFVSRFSNCHFFENDGYGFNALAGTSLDLSSCYARANMTGGYRLSTVAYSTLTACAADDNTGAAYSLIQCFSIAMVGCGSETTLPDGVHSVVEIEGSIACTIQNYFSSTDLVGAGAGDSLIRVRDGVSRNADSNTISGVYMQSIQVDYTVDVNTTLDCSSYVLGSVAGGLVATVLDAGNKVGQGKGASNLRLFKPDRTLLLNYTNSTETTTLELKRGNSSAKISSISGYEDSVNEQGINFNTYSFGAVSGSKILPSGAHQAPNTAGHSFVNGVKVISGSGSPEGVYGAVVGSLYLRSDGGAGTSLYVKESGSSSIGWVAK